MICQVCKEDHRTLVNKWCDRSLSEIEIDYLKEKLAIAVEALEIVADPKSIYDALRAHKKAREALLMIDKIGTIR